ncbi:MAG: hypothetical protein V4731_17710 [Pseudomonadota bacterium]
MGIVSLSRSAPFAGVFAPLFELLAHWPFGRTAQEKDARVILKAGDCVREGIRSTCIPCSPRIPAPGIRAVAAHTEKRLRSQPSTRHSRLRVLRTFEPGVSPSCAGRMVISGRMADVCAELERLTSQSAPLH